ncbi:MAG: pilus assembly protein PilP [Myxococcota bacterium]
MMRSVLALSGLIVCSACGGDEAPPPPPEKPVPAQTGLNALTGGSEAVANAADPAPASQEQAPPPAEATNPNEEAEAEVPYAYSPIGKRDPFRNIFEQLADGPEEQELTELQKFELDQLRLVAVVTRIATPYAMVEDPNGKGHTLVRGTLIGKHFGQIAQIREDCVVVKEDYRDYTGRKVTNSTSMCLPKPEDLKLD